MIEATTVILCGLLFFVFASLGYVYSVILGGFAFIVPNALFIRYSLRTSAADSADRALVWFYLGEAIKVVTTIMIFAVSFILITPLNIGLMFAAYGFVLLMNLTGLAILMNN